MPNLLDHSIGYLNKNTTRNRPFFSGSQDQNQNLVAFCDAALGNEKETMKSTGGIVIFLGASMISSYAFTQRFVNTSSNEAELKVLCMAAKHLLFISKGCLSTTQLPVTRKFKFMSIYIAFLKELAKRIELQILKIPRDKNIADYLTKQGTPEEQRAFQEHLYTPFEWTHQLGKE